MMSSYDQQSTPTSSLTHCVGSRSPIWYQHHRVPAWLADLSMCCLANGLGFHLPQDHQARSWNPWQKSPPNPPSIIFKTWPSPAQVHPRLTLLRPLRRGIPVLTTMCCRKEPGADCGKWNVALPCQILENFSKSPPMCSCPTL